MLASRVLMTALCYNINMVFKGELFITDSKLTAIRELPKIIQCELNNKAYYHLSHNVVICDLHLK